MRCVDRKRWGKSGCGAVKTEVNERKLSKCRRIRTCLTKVLQNSHMIPVHVDRRVHVLCEAIPTLVNLVVKMISQLSVSCSRSREETRAYDWLGYAPVRCIYGCLTARMHPSWRVPFLSHVLAFSLLLESLTLSPSLATNETSAVRL